MAKPILQSLIVNVDMKAAERNSKSDMFLDNPLIKEHKNVCIYRFLQ